MAIQIAHAPSYYAASAHPSLMRDALSGTLDCDVCVVGGGIAGCSAALHLAERGYRVVLLEENRIGWGASGRSGAQAIYGLAAPQSKVVRLVGAGGGPNHLGVAGEAFGPVPGVLSKNPDDCDLGDGPKLTTLKPRH